MRMNTQLSVRPSLCTVLILTLTTMVLAAPAFADDPRDRSALAVALDERVAAGDLKYRDSRTGDVVVATHARIELLRLEMAPLFGWPVEAEITTADDGTVRARDNGAMRDVYLVRTNLDGTRTGGCFRDLDTGIAFVVGLHEDIKRRLDDHAHEAVTE